MIQKINFRSILLSIVSLVLIVIAWKTGAGAYEQWADTLTPGQKTETVIQFICCLLSICVLHTAWFKIPLANYIQYAWGLSFISMAVLSSLVWGPPMLLPAIAFALISGVIAFVVIFTIIITGPHLSQASAC